MVNLGDVLHCDICGEHKESGIPRHGFYASPFSPAVELIQVESEARVRDKGTVGRAETGRSLKRLWFEKRTIVGVELRLGKGRVLVNEEKESREECCRNRVVAIAL
ncbi:hypothetical protein GQ457_02G016700 [Hibiscus cannabinus]